jgi:tetratricopeptide (TPR) repeat protein
MRAPRRSLALLVWLAPLAPSTAAAEARWVRVRSAHYEVLTDASAGEGKRVARHLEQFRQLISQILTGGKSIDSERVSVLAFRNQRSFDPFAPRYRGKPVKLGGYFMQGPDRGYIVLNLSSGWENYQNLYHEQIHLIFSPDAPERAAWLVEGVAELYSTWTTVASELQVGRPLESHLEVLGREGLIPFARFLAVDRDSPYYNEEEKQGIFYAQAWALTHYLVVENFPEGFPRLRTYLAALDAGQEPLAAFQRAFGPLAQVEKALNGYIGRRSYKYFRFDVASTKGDDTAEVSTPSPAEVQYALGDLLLQRGGFDEAGRILQQAVALDGTFVPARLALVRVHLESKEIVEAKEELRKAFALSPRSSDAYYLQAETLLRTGGDAPHLLSSESVAEIIRALETALEIAPDMAKARTLLDRLQKAKAEVMPPALFVQPPEPEVPSSGVGSELAPPEVPELASARRLARRGDFTRAMEALLQIEQTASTPIVRDRARIEREQLRETGAGTLQAEGTLVMLRCLPNLSLSFVVRAGARTLTLRAASPTSLMLYGPEGDIQERGLACGPQKAAVLARYRPGAPQGASGVDGTVLALYFR